MENSILIFGLLIGLMATRIVLAQEGTISYNMKVNIHRTLPADRQEMKDIIPEFNVHRNRLTFRMNETLYVNVDEDEEDSFGDEGGAVKIRMRRPMNEFYFNHNTGRSIIVREFLGKKFLIEDSIRVLPWKLHNESKVILGYNCRKATWFDEERKLDVTAWYTDQLAPHLGPENYNSLPGAVLEVNINDGERVITASKFSNEKLSKDELRIPVRGQKTTEAEFRKMVEEQRKRMGGNGNIIIRN